MSNCIGYLGFVRGKKEDEDILRNLGMLGEMNYKNGNFEMCFIPFNDAPKIVLNLRKNYPSFDDYVSTFTGINNKGKPCCGMSKSGTPIT